MKKYIYIILIISVFMLTEACKNMQVYTNESTTEEVDYYNKSYLRLDNWVYKNYIKTVRLFKSGSEIGMPMIQLNRGQQLKLEFDDLEAGLKNFQYTVIHCDADWKKTGLLENEYLEGFYTDYITEYEYSLNTLQNYTHYTLKFPNENIKLTKSGNYILLVYNLEEENYILTRRFMVTEDLCNISAKVRPALNVGKLAGSQEVRFTLDMQNYKVGDAYSELKVVVMQNNRWDNRMKSIPPKSVDGSLISFDYDNKIVFKGGNEFRYVDLRSLKATIWPVTKIVRDSNMYLVYKEDDVLNTNSFYMAKDDVNGNYIIKTYDQDISETESEYVRMNFRLKRKSPFATGNVYVFGGLSDWQFDKSNLMTYNYKENAYEAQLILKQGYYNFQFCLLENNQTAAKVDEIEGSYRETENNYHILIYHANPGDFYDRLIGVESLNTILKDNDLDD